MAIYHIVLVKFKPEATAEQRASWVAGVKKVQAAVPQLKELKSGKKIILNGEDSGWDDGAIGIFDSVADLEAYESSEPHLKFVQGIIPIMADKLAYDIEV